MHRNFPLLKCHVNIMWITFCVNVEGLLPAKLFLFGSGASAASTAGSGNIGFHKSYICFACSLLEVKIFLWTLEMHIGRGVAMYCDAIWSLPQTYIFYINFTRANTWRLKLKRKDKQQKNTRFIEGRPVLKHSFYFPINDGLHLFLSVNS